MSKATQKAIRQYEKGVKKAIDRWDAGDHSAEGFVNALMHGAHRCPVYGTADTVELDFQEFDQDCIAITEWIVIFDWFRSLPVGSLEERVVRYFFTAVPTHMEMSWFVDRPLDDSDWLLLEPYLHVDTDKIIDKITSDIERYYYSHSPKNTHYVRHLYRALPAFLNALA